MNAKDCNTALANKLARVTWGVLRNGEPFDIHRHEVTASSTRHFVKVRD